MIRKAITIGAATLICALPAAAQQRGTVEFGAFGSAGKFDQSLTLDKGFGAGGRIGLYLDPRWSIEFEDQEFHASRTLGLGDVNVGDLSGRLVAALVKSGGFSILLGAGAGASTETNFLHSYGVNALLGASFKISPLAAIRVDGVAGWLANYSWKSNQSVRVGLTLFRSPNHMVRTIETPAPQREDSVTAEEQGRRRRFERDYRELRDSIGNIRACVCSVPAPEPARARELFTLRSVLFEFDESTLTGGAKDTLGVAVRFLKEHADVRVEIQGNTDSKGSDDYNMALGDRRAESVKAYLATQGISADRVTTKTFGESQPVADNEVNGKDNPPGRALNRRVLIIELP
jgi:outer membrane protein OmpA-like peptidoglycan-associated protein